MSERARCIPGCGQWVEAMAGEIAGLCRPSLPAGMFADVAAAAAGIRWLLHATADPGSVPAPAAEWAGRLGAAAARGALGRGEVTRAVHVITTAAHLRVTANCELGGACDYAARLWPAAQRLAAFAESAWLTGQRDNPEGTRLLADLLGGAANEGTASAAAQACHLDKDGAYVAIVVLTDGWSAPPVGLDELPATVAGTRARWLLDAGRATGVVPVADPAAAAALAGGLRVGAGRRAGVSLTVMGLAALGQAARWALLAARTATPGHVAYLGENLPAALLAARPDLARELATRVLGPVLAMDRVSRDLLLDTLSAWFNAGGSASRAASALYCHRNTVLNRIRRTERIIKRDLSDARDVRDVALALDAARAEPGLSRPPKIAA